MKGVCHICSKSRHFCLSMPGDRYLKLDSQADHRAEISGTDHLVKRFGATSCVYFPLFTQIFLTFLGTFFVAGESFQELSYSTPSKHSKNDFLFSSSPCHFSYIVYCARTNTKTSASFVRLRAQFLKSPDNFSGPKGQFPNCNLLGFEKLIF